MSIKEEKWPSSIWACVGVFLLITVINVAYGYQYLFDGESLALYFRIMTIPFLVILFFLTKFAFSSWSSCVEILRSCYYLGFFMMSLSLIMTLYFYSYKIQVVPWYIIAFAGVLLAFACHHKFGIRGSAIAYFTYIFVVYCFLIMTVPHTQGANMLELIEAAGRDFFNGVNPYDKDYSPITGFPFGYLPGLWLPYSLIQSMGLDVRVLNLICFGLIVLIFKKGFGLDKVGPAVMAITIYPTIFSPPVAQMIVHGHVWPYWTLLLLTIAMLLKRNHLVAAVLFGITLSTRQSSLFLLGPLAIFMYYHVCFKKLMIYSLLSIFIYLLIVLPFAFWTGFEFWINSYISLSQTTTLDFLVNQINGSATIYSFGLMDMLIYIQLLIIVSAMIVIGIKKKVSYQQFVFMVGIVYLWAIFFNPYVIRYEYIPGFLLLGLALMSHLAQQKESIDISPVGEVSGSQGYLWRS